MVSVRTGVHIRVRVQLSRTLQIIQVMDKYKCNNTNCNNTFSIADNREPGGVNAPCILEVECKECSSLTYIQSYNHTIPPHVKGDNVKRVIEGKLHEHPEIPYLEILYGPEGLDLKENQLKWQADGFNLWKVC